MRQIRITPYTKQQRKWLILLYMILSFLIVTIPVLIYVFIIHVYKNLIGTPINVVLFLLFVITLIFGIYVTIRFINEITHEVETSKYELALKDIIIQHSDEIIMLLDKYGIILSVNPILTAVLNYNKDELLNKPFRTILYEQSFEEALHLRDLLLSRFKHVFSGYNAEIVLPCKVQHYSEIKSIAFKLIPILHADQLQYILAIGRIIQSDYLTSNYLKNEYAEFIIDNDIRKVSLLSYRLTRNLEPYLDKHEIIRVQLCLQEAIVNAIEHGNLEIDFHTKSLLKKKEGNYWDHVLDICNKEYLEKRKVTVQYFLNQDSVKYIITDEGKGFDWRAYMQSGINANLINNYHGVGLVMLQDVFEVSFNEKGNEITLVKRFK